MRLQRHLLCNLVSVLTGLELIGVKNLVNIQLALIINVNFETVR